MIAKEQMDAEIDSEQPASNKVGGPLAIEAQWLGIGDDWEDINSIYNQVQVAWTTGSAQAWIHSGTQLLTGVTAQNLNPIRIGQNAVHVVYGIQSLHASPKIEAVQFTIDDKEKPKLLTFWAQKSLPGAARPVKELDSCYIFNKDKTVHAHIFISDSYGALSTLQTDFPALVGVSYVKEPALRLLDPDKAAHTIEGTRYEIVHAI